MTDLPALPPPWDDEKRAVHRLKSAVLNSASLSSATSNSAAPPLSPWDWPVVRELATPWLQHLREHPPSFWAMESLLQAYPLSSAQGLALMRLAEALLRIPDADTLHLLVSDQLEHGHFDHLPSDALSAHPWWEALSHRVLHLAAHMLPPHAPSSPQDHHGALVSVLERLGQQATVKATLHAVALLGRQFVVAPRIESAWQQARRESAAAEAHTAWSFDMLGEGARTWADADRYLAAYEHALNHLADQQAAGQGLSVKLSALHPRYEHRHEDDVVRQLLPRVVTLARQAAQHDLLLTLDAEESDRLGLQLKVINALLQALSDARVSPAWQGLGMAVQAYQFRAPALVQRLASLAQAHQRTLSIRLVKGAYWDGEIKRAQELGLPGYPVYTRKSHTDLAYLSCARLLLQHSPQLRPQFATHNAVTIAAVMSMARAMGVKPTQYEWQRLHGMGESTYACIREHTDAAHMAPVRVYAPVGPQRELLAYLVRRLLENGANSSFVHRLADPHVTLDELLVAPWDGTEDEAPWPEPCQAWGGPHTQAPGRDLSHPEHLRLLDEAIQNARQQAQQGRGVPPAPVPAAQASQLMAALHQAWPDWELTPWSDRIAVLERVADQLSQHLDDWAADLVIEAHKTIDDAVAEVRETIDMARYYAHQARVLAQGQSLPGPTGEDNRWLLRGRGVLVCIAPWNFPLAIFGGQVMAALVTGNAVAAKSAPQTPCIGERFVRLLQACGVPDNVLHHVPGDGLTGAALVAHPQCAGVVFTGSCDTAKRLQRSLAEGHRPIVPLIAETGGINAMIVDSSALPEQVVDAVIHSAFHSAGQRCSALRLLCLHQAVAIDMERMLSGAMQCLRLGWPHDPRTDIGPVIDQAAAERLKRWEHTLEARAAQPGSGVSLLARTPWPEPGHPPGSDGLHWVAPSAWRLPNVAALDAEHFGPILHVVHWGPGTSAPTLEALVQQINAQGFGLTMGLHTRLDTRVEAVQRLARVGNLYVNRGMTGAVVGAQPFGGQGWSGTGPKAGGPWYLQRFTTEQVVSINTTAAGGNATLLAGLTR